MQTHEPAEIHLCRCGQVMDVRDAMTLGYREDPPVYVCPSGPRSADTTPGPGTQRRGGRQWREPSAEVPRMVVRHGRFRATPGPSVPMNKSTAAQTPAAPPEKADRIGQDGGRTCACTEASDVGAARVAGSVAGG